ncbi:RNA polymerase recycling motor HelD [Clostridium tagluense]|uniref:RNA polymerase recycling motor HelD n=1 Tax=Clostridium tagluense TaxID=360422 RepID=UPI001C0D92F0|nr:RNA polymerase recycling motor HelD [Clostridium tagluense]MBU3127641.1 AAA family ATPase [Clostridium tagluense]
MAINKSEMELEKRRLEETVDWLNKQVNLAAEKHEELEKKVSMLKKSSGGTYNEELALTQQVYEFANNNLQKYSEASHKPYFARIDFSEVRRDKESYYIGKFGLNDSSEGEEKVIDWRAPIAELYYSGQQGKVSYKAPIGFIDGVLSLKRKFLIENEKLENAFDEGINDIILRSSSDETEDNALVDEFLKINLEQSIGSKLKDVVATIQKEQNEIIRASKNTVMIIQGSAGSGKTTVALHRLAYLMYKYSENLTTHEILVIAPNKLFLDYISDILPSLGVSGVKQSTFEDIACSILKYSGKIHTKDMKFSLVIEESNKEKVKFITTSSKFKGSMTYKSIMDRYLKYIENKDIQIEDIMVGEYILFSSNEIKRLYSKDLVNFPLNKRKQEIKRYFNLKLKVIIPEVFEKIDYAYEKSIQSAKRDIKDELSKRKKIIELYDKRDEEKKHFNANAKKAMDEYFKQWSQKSIIDLYFNLLVDEEVFTELTEGKIGTKLYDFIKSETIASISGSIIDSDDLAALLYLKLKIEGLDKFNFSHIVIDEAQDYSNFQLLMLKSIAVNDSFTIVGDIGQGIYYYKGIESWQKLISEVFKGQANYIPLTQSYRSTIEIINVANRVLQKQENYITPASPVLRHGKEPDLISYSVEKEFVEKLDEIVKSVKISGKKSIAVIGKTFKECKYIKTQLKKYSENDWELIKNTDKNFQSERIIIPSYMTKGLEFDCSIVYNCDEESYGDNELDKKILYVVLTRALHMEYIFYKGKPSSLLE